MISDLLDTSYQFKDLYTLNLEYNLRWTFLDYMRIRQTIPHCWHQILGKDNDRSIKPDLVYDKLSNIKTLKTKDIYWMIIPNHHDTTTIPNAHQTWQNKYDLTDEMLKAMYILPYRSCKHTYIQSIQYKLLYKVVNYNYWLNKLKIINSPICRLCDEIDTVEHFFFACRITKLFWKSVLNWWNHLNVMYVDELIERAVLFSFCSKLRF